MARRKKKTRYKKIFGIIIFLIALPLSVKLLMMSMPYMNAAASKAALLSAGLTFPEGGKPFFWITAAVFPSLLHSRQIHRQSAR